MAKANLDPLDIKILEILSKNAKTPFLEIARICNVSGAAIHQHIQQLTSSGVIMGSVFLLSPEKIGLTTCALIGLRLGHNANASEIVEELKNIPEIVECHYTSGIFPITIKVYTKDNADFLNLVQYKLLPLEGVEAVEPTISLTECFSRQISL